MRAKELRQKPLALIVVFILTLTSCDLNDTSDSVFIESAEELKVLEVPYGTGAEEVVDALNEKRDEVEVNLDTGEVVTADAAWSEEGIPENYDSHTPDTYIFEGTAAYNGLSYDLEIDVKLQEHDGTFSIAGKIHLENEEIVLAENEVVLEVTAESAGNEDEIYHDTVVIADPEEDFYYEFEDMPEGEEFNLEALINTEETTAENTGSFSIDLKEDSFVVEAGVEGPEITVKAHDLLIEEKGFSLE